MSGWGKSWYAQLLLETNLPEFDRVAVFDYKDEFRGLVKAGLATHYIVGKREQNWSVSDWETFFESNPKVVLARHRLTPEDWREVTANTVQALRNLAGPSNAALAAIDEAHFVAPQSGNIPDAIEGLATTGRGEGASSMWITQRLAKLDETVGAQCDERLVGGFTSDRDRKKIDPEYPEDVHNPQARNVPRLPEELRADGGSTPLRRFEEGGSTVGSEWVYSNNKGEMERRDTREMEMNTTHHGPEGHPIHDPA